MTPEEQAAHDAAEDQQLKDLATQIAAMTQLGFDPMTIRKAIIASVNDAATPPTVSLNISGDTETLVTEVRILNNYTPLVDQTVLLAKQGTEIFLLGSIASVDPRSAAESTASDNGWVAATLSAGTGGSGDNAVRYRRIMDHGSWKMQWRGEWNPAGNLSMITAGNALDPDFRPAGRRGLPAARDAVGSTTCRMEFSPDGTVRYYSASPAINTTGDLGGGTGSNGGFDYGGHSHGISDTYGAAGEFVQSDGTSVNGAFSVGSHSHGIDTGSHNHGGSTVVTAPTWISLNGLEYFL